MWIFLKGSRIILHVLRQECLEKLRSTYSDLERSESTATIEASADAVFSVIAYMTEPLDRLPKSGRSRGPKNAGGYYLLWPLHIIVGCKYLDKARRSIARDALLKIGREKHLNHALEIAQAVE